MGDEDDDVVGIEEAPLPSNWHRRGRIGRPPKVPIVEDDGLQAERTEIATEVLREMATELFKEPLLPEHLTTEQLIAELLRRAR